ncbi:MAG: hypothetical protein IT582_02205, partial [Opitutaceae bacterium]|nr:hypothetical protein [Opitutaceae bacterium]
MTVSPLWRNRLAAICSAVLALWLGTQLAQQEFFWPMLVGGFLATLALTRFFQMPFDVIFLGGILFGYTAGNRGFAQVSLLSFFPLLPAEFVLLVAGAALLVQSAFRQVRPVRRDSLNLLILLWMILCSLRIPLDVRAHGFNAIRDYATVYYAALFFIAQALAAHARHRAWLLQCVIVGSIAMLVLYPLTELFPGFFYDVLTLRGNALIAYKGDLVGTLLVAGGVLCYHRYEPTRPGWAAVASLILIGASLATNNRSSLVALVSLLGLFALARRWRLPALVGAAGALSVAGILFFAYLTNTPWRHTPLHGAYERAASIIDLAGTGRYTGADTFFKGDNNRFR